MEAFILYLRERPLLNANTTQNGVSQTTINRTLSALSSLFKYLTEEVENEQGEPYFYRNVMKKVSTKKKKETLAARAENIKQKLFWAMKRWSSWTMWTRNTKSISLNVPSPPSRKIRSGIWRFWRFSWLLASVCQKR